MSFQKQIDAKLHTVFCEIDTACKSVSNEENEADDLTDFVQSTSVYF